MLARASFGMLGSNVPALMRALVGCGWFGIQTWIGGQAIYTMLKVALPQSSPRSRRRSGSSLLAVEPVIVVRGSESIKRLEAYAARS